MDGSDTFNKNQGILISMEFSFVSVPANPGALIVERSAKAEALKLLKPDNKAKDAEKRLRIINLLE